MNSLHKQRGVTAIGWIIILLLIAFFALIGLRLAPVYIEHFNVVSSLDSLKNEAFITRKDPVEIKRLLTRRFDINQITNATAENVTVSRKKGVLTVEVRYEVRKKFLGNVDVVTSFADKIEVVAN